MRRKVMFTSNRMSKAQLSIYVLILLPLLVPCEVFAGGQTKLVSVSSTGVQGNDESRNSSISSDGRYVAFDSNASNLVANDSNRFSDIFVHDRQMALVTRVSVSSAGEQVYGGSFNPSISSDGRHVAFHSGASDLVTGDSNGFTDIFVHDRLTAQTTRVSVSTMGLQGNESSSYPSISSDGMHVAFESDANNIVADDSNGSKDIFVHDRQTAQTTRVSVSSTGVQGNSISYNPSISSDGRYIAFESDSSNLVANDDNGSYDIFLHDRQTAQTTRVSVSSAGVQGDLDSFSPSISSDGRFVAFDSTAMNLVTDDSTGSADIFVHDRQTAQTTRVSVSSTGVQGNNHSYFASISSEGRYVAFTSGASNLVADDSNGFTDIFVHDRLTAQTTRVSVSSTGVQGNDECKKSSISSEGRYVAFPSDASNLVAGDSNGFRDIFVHDRPPGFLPCVPLILLGN